MDSSVVKLAITADLGSAVEGSSPSRRTDKECSRCGFIGKSVQQETWCSVCGPTDLCTYCNNLHWEDTDGGTDLL